MCLIEAMASGCAIVATAVGGVPDVLHSPALGSLVEDGDVDGVATAIRELLDHPERRAAMGTAARVHALSAYDATHLARRVGDLYSSLLRANSDELPAGSHG